MQEEREVRKRKGVSSHSLLGLDGEGEDCMGPAALSVHGGGRHSPVDPPSPQHLPATTGRETHHTVTVGERDKHLALLQQTLEKTSAACE